MLKKKFGILIVVVLFILCLIFFVPHQKVYTVLDVVSPDKIILDSGMFSFKDYDSFDCSYTEKNKILAEKLNITEKDAFLLGNLGKNQALNLMKGRKVFVTDNNDLIYFKYSYLEKFKQSGFCLKDSKPYSDETFLLRLKDARQGKFAVLDLDNDIVYKPDDKQVCTLKHFIVMRYSHLPRKFKFKTENNRSPVSAGIKPEYIMDKGALKIFFTDSTVKLKPSRECESSICKEILSNINMAQNTIDIAIYGYSTVPAIEKALAKAKERGVKIRLVYDADSEGKNIYENTSDLIKLIPESMSDKNSSEPACIMHNKFYIFDDRVLITGSANLSHTDMSGFNSNSAVVINSPEAAKIYKREFEQMYNGKFHTGKDKYQDNSVNLGNIQIRIYFSPQDKSISNAVLPLIDNAKEYIYIPTFMITEKRTVEALIKAKKRGVDVKIIIDALNASGRYSKHQELRNNGVLVKTENYAGKMHSKSMIVDDEYTLLGSMNFSYSGENKNDENLIVIKDSETAEFYLRNFLYQWGRIDDKWLRLNARAEGKDSIGSCEDGIDNNYDGLTDKDDSACK